MAERLVSTKDYTQGIPPDLKQSALLQIEPGDTNHSAQSTFNEACRLLLSAIHNKKERGSNGSTFTKNDVRALSSAFTVWGVTRKTAEAIVRGVIK